MAGPVDGPVNGPVNEKGTLATKPRGTGHENRYFRSGWVSYTFEDGSEEEVAIPIGLNFFWPDA